MAETVLSMARSMLGSAIRKAAAAAAEEMSLLLGVQKEIWFMKDELKTMQAFLIAAEAMKKKDLLLKVWAEQIRSVSYDVEDCLDEFMVHVGSQSLSQQLMKLKDRHQIAIQIRNLKSRVEEVSSRNTRYNLIKTEATNIDETDSYMEDVRNHSAGNIDEAELVGFATSKQKLLDMIKPHDNNGDARVICVVGMGGLGKTTLVRKMYESKEDIAKNFSCCAWITVSQSFSRIEMLKDMIGKLFGADSLQTCLKKHEGKVVLVEHLAPDLRKRLEEKRYFIVLDDLWNIPDWKWIRDVSLPSNNNKGSRIIVTTRDVGLAKQCTSESLIYELKPLKNEHAIDLLLRKMRKSKEETENDEKLKTIVTKLVRKCGGLPLAIAMIGALFATKHVSEWDNLYTQLPSELENNLSLEAITRMVTLSYNHLPSHLKPCFLYLSIFPEDFEIKRRRLVGRWIAEGLVRARVGMTTDDVGESYFNELISRSMIQPSKLNIEGHVKRCRVHDIIRDIIVSISRDESFVYSTGYNVPRVVEENFRHVAYHDSNSPTVGMDWSRVRSLTFFGERPVEPVPSLCSPQLRMLRALDLENAQFTISQKEINNIGLLRHLKYVNARYGLDLPHIYALPRSIGKLQGLQSLDIRNSYITTIPSEISKLLSLRSLRCSKRSQYSYFNLDDPKNCLVETLCLPMIFTRLVDDEEHPRSEMIANLHMAYSSHWSSTHGVRFPRGIGNLKELQILEVVDMKRTSRKAIEELGELSMLRKLGVTTQGATEKKHMTFCKALERHSALRSLRIYAGEGTLEWLGSVCSPPPELRILCLEGYIGEMPGWFRNLTKLVNITLIMSQLKEGKTMEILGALPNLMLLRLWKKSYVGEELVFREGTFPKLKKLYMCYPHGLREVRFEKDASPHMETIYVGGCSLASGIIGIKHLPRLKEISLGCKVARLGILQDEVKTHPNEQKPLLRLEDEPSDHDLGDTEGSDVFFEAMESLPDQAGEGSQVITVTASDI